MIGFFVKGGLHICIENRKSRKQTVKSLLNRKNYHIVYAKMMIP